MTAPAVVYAAPDGSYYDDTRRAWDPRTTQPLVPEKPPRPLHHAADCCYRHAPELVEVCPCTARTRAARGRHPH